MGNLVIENTPTVRSNPYYYSLSIHPLFHHKRDLTAGIPDLIGTLIPGPDGQEISQTVNEWNRVTSILDDTIDHAVS